MRKVVILIVFLSFCSLNAASHEEKIDRPNYTDKIFFSGKYISFWSFEVLKASKIIWKILNLPKKKITILGGSRVKEDSFYYRKANELTIKCIEAKIGLLYGGGSGIMQAVEDAIAPPDFKLRIIVDKLTPGKSLQHTELTSSASFEIRQWALLNFSDTAVFFPGGVGTLYELFQMLTLIDTGLLNSEMRIILFGKEHWIPLIAYLKTLTFQKKLIGEKVLQGIVVTDSIEETFDIILKSTQDKDKIQSNIGKNINTDILSSKPNPS